MAGQDVCHEKQHEGAAAPSSCSVAFRHNRLIFSVTDDESSLSRGAQNRPRKGALNRPLTRS